MTTVVITGAAGFIGSHLAHAILSANRSARVVGIDNFDSFYPRDLKERNVSDLLRERFTLHEIDIRDAQNVVTCFERAQPDAIYHIAALAGVRPSIAEPARYADVNVNGTVNVLQAARACGCRTFIFASSSSVYGNRDADANAFAEDDDISRPISPYAATKCAGEALCHTYAHLFGLRIGMIRFFTVYGPAQRPDLAISKFMRRMSEGEPIEMFGNGGTARDYTYIDDIVSGLLRVREHLDEQDAGFARIWNLGNSSPVLLKELIDSIARVTGMTPRIRQGDMQPGDVVRTCADLTRVRQELGWEPQIPLETGLTRQWEWMSDAAHVTHSVA